jgi:hypothetical protein
VATRCLLILALSGLDDQDIASQTAGRGQQEPIEGLDTMAIWQGQIS